MKESIFTSSTRVGTTISHGHLIKTHKGLAFCRAKALPLFLSYFKTLTIGPAPGIFRGLNSQPPALKSRTLLTELCLVLLKHININAEVHSELPSHLNSL